jgi:hypothetical protein
MRRSAGKMPTLPGTRLAPAQRSDYSPPALPGRIDRRSTRFGLSDCLKSPISGGIILILIVFLPAR